MKTHTPLIRKNLHIKKSDRVLEVGPGHNPTYRADVIVEKFIDSNYHRCGDLKIFPHQKLINAEGEKLPFKDKEFDYVICNHVLEHSEDPVTFIKEQMRVAKRGYMETPSLIGEFLSPKQSHKWAILELDGKLILFEKANMPAFSFNFGSAFLNHLPYQSLAYKILLIVEPMLTCIKYEWSDSIEYIVNPTDEKYVSYFTKPWTLDMTRKLFPPRSASKELIKLIIGLWNIIVLQLDKFNKKIPLSLDEYEVLHKKK